MTKSPDEFYQERLKRVIDVKALGHEIKKSLTEVGSILSVNNSH